MIKELYSPKQIEVLNFAMKTDFFMLINHGAKRSGKTIIDNDLFLVELKRVKKIADKLKVPLPQYILAGADLGALQRNVLNEITNKYGIEFKFDRYNRFILFGVQICCFGHSKINDLGRIRGMTSFGAYINEATIANEEVFNEIKSRCSAEGARIICDTNPSNPEHYIKKNYIDKADGKIIKSISWELDDNIFLTDRYLNNIKETTPSGMFYDRDIKGQWVMADGAIYSDFDKSVHYIKDISDIKFVKYIAGVDWGYSHFGAIVVLGIDEKGNYYLIEEIAKQFEEIDFWVKQAKIIKLKYGNIPFYCDTARPEYVEKFKNEHLKAIDANKEVLSGIESVAKLYKSNKLHILETVAIRFKEEIYMYVWKEKADEPLKVFDDVQDAIRYAIHTLQNEKKIETSTRRGI